MIIKDSKKKENIRSHKLYKMHKVRKRYKIFYVKIFYQSTYTQLSSNKRFEKKYFYKKIKNRRLNC